MSKEVQREQKIRQGVQEAGKSEQGQGQAQGRNEALRGRGQGQGNLTMPTDRRSLVRGDTCSIFPGCEEREIIKPSYQGFREAVGVI